MHPQITIQSAVANLAGTTRAREWLKLTLRSVSNWRISNGWMLLLNSQPLLRELAGIRPRLIYKVYRPYLSLALPSTQRLAALRDHYCFMFAKGLGPLTLRAARTPITIATVTGKSGAAYQLTLVAVGPMEREGELVLQLMQDKQLIYSCAFSFLADDAGMLLAIGCLQGPKAAHGLQLIREATRALHGLRPKNMLVRLLAHLAHHHNCVGIRLVGNANRVVRSALKQGVVYADYDEFWENLSAVRRLDGDYDLACEPIGMQDMASIPSRKRAEMRKRHDVLDTLATALCQPN